MLSSFSTQTVTVIRPATRYSRGSPIPDWEHAETFDVENCDCQPDAATDHMEGRVANQSLTASLFTPADADIRVGDRVEALGMTWRVAQAQPAWPHFAHLAHREFQLEAWEG